MRAPARRSGRRLVGGAIVASLLALVVLPAYLLIAPAWRPVVLRLSCAAAVAFGGIHARRWARSALAARSMSPLDAPSAPSQAAVLDPGFCKLRDDLIASTRNRRYFDVILWPRLSALAGAELPRPGERRLMTRRGPSLTALEGLVARIERRP